MYAERFWMSGGACESKCFRNWKWHTRTHIQNFMYSFKTFLVRRHISKAFCSLREYGLHGYRYTLRHFFVLVVPELTSIQQFYWAAVATVSERWPLPSGDYPYLFLICLSVCPLTMFSVPDHPIPVLHCLLFLLYHKFLVLLSTIYSYLTYRQVFCLTSL